MLAYLPTSAVRNAFSTGFKGVARGITPDMTATITDVLDNLADRIERASVLDKPANVVANLVAKLVPHGKARDLASGKPIGHPLHPLLVAVPIGSWVAASALDMTGGDAKAARRLVGLGVATAVPSVISGASDWSTTVGGERRIGLVHAAVNDVALTLYVGSWLARLRGRRLKGTALGLAGLGVLSAGGWLGGHLAYANGVGVDTTAFQTIPTEWTDVAAEADVSERPISVTAGGTSVLLARTRGRIVAMADRCTHRGGPLHEGKVCDGKVVCPWHGSEFALDDGSVQRGPAVRPQPTAEVRVVDGRVQVRRPDEPRSLRADSV
jgi:nitrite reductase/ring-hydroxylating ferredoxin subunit/uncharacterized membrane protein